MRNKFLRNLFWTAVAVVAVILIVRLVRSSAKPPVPVISTQAAISRGYDSGYWDGSHSNTWHFSYKDSLYRLAGVYEQYDSAYEEGYRKGYEYYKAEQERRTAYLNRLYKEGYDLGVEDGKRSSMRDFLKNPYNYDSSVEGAGNSFHRGYNAGREAGLVIFRQEQDEYFRKLHEEEAKKQAQKQVVPKPSDKSSLPKGYQDGYEDGYEDGCENDYKDSWNPRSNNRQYLIDYNEGYNEGFESGRLDYIEDYWLEGDFEEDWW